MIIRNRGELKWFKETGKDKEVFYCESEKDGKTYCLGTKDNPVMCIYYHTKTCKEKRK